MTHRFDLMVTAWQTLRDASATRRKIGSSTPEGLGGALHPHCGATAGESVHGPMT